MHIYINTYIHTYTNGYIDDCSAHGGHEIQNNLSCVIVFLSASRHKFQWHLWLLVQYVQFFS